MTNLAIIRGTPHCSIRSVVAVALGMAITFGGCVAKAADASNVSQDARHYAADIKWTRYGIPHIEAKDFDGLGFGAGYAFAKENACLLFDAVLTVRGERSEYLGSNGPALPGFIPARNIDSDIFFRSYFDVGALTAAYRQGSPEA